MHYFTLSKADVERVSVLNYLKALTGKSKKTFYCHRILAKFLTKIKTCLKDLQNDF